MNKILEFIKRNNNFADIRKFIGENYEEANSSDCDRSFYASSDATYIVSPIVFLFISTSTDRFGANSTSGYCVYVQNILTNDSITLYNKDVTTINGKTTVEISTIFDDENAENLIKEFPQGEYVPNKSDFLALKDHIFAYWTNLQPQEKMDEDVLKKLLDEIFFDACMERQEIIEYDAISPYGGEDITYFPHSDGECFMDNIYILDKYLDGISSNDIGLEYLKKYHPEDKYLK